MASRWKFLPVQSTDLLARTALEEAGSASVVLNAANEIAVAAFLDRKISFGDIARLVEDALNRRTSGAPESIEDVVYIDAQVRRETLRSLEGLAA